MDEAGIKEEQKDDDAGEAEGETEAGSELEEAAALPKSPERRLEELEVHLAEAVKREDYEEAARLRDEISRLKGRG